jgi:hypothetical protein
LATFFRGKMYSLILIENGLGYILGDFFTNSSGHPARHSVVPFEFERFDPWDVLLNRWQDQTCPFEISFGVTRLGVISPFGRNFYF